MRRGGRGGHQGGVDALCWLSTADLLCQLLIDRKRYHRDDLGLSAIIAGVRLLGDTLERLLPSRIKHLRAFRQEVRGVACSPSAASKADNEGSAFRVHRSEGVPPSSAQDFCKLRAVARAVLVPAPSLVGVVVGKGDADCAHPLAAIVGPVVRSR